MQLCPFTLLAFAGRRAGPFARVVFVALAATLPLRAATHRDEVLRLVPADAGFCLVVQDLGRHARALAESPFLEQFRQSPLGRELAGSDPARKLAEVDRNLDKALGLNWQKLRDDFLGDTVVFAYRTGSDGKEQGLFLLRARDAAELTRVVGRLNDLQTRSGEVKAIEARSHGGHEYFCRVENGRKQFYALRGPVLAVTAQEEMLKSSLDCDRRPVVGLGALGSQFRRLGLDGSLVVLWVNPRAFDAEIEKKAAAAQGAEALVLNRVLAYWKALDGIALSATARRSEVELGASFLAREGELPPAARRFFAANPTPSDLWGRFPADAMLALAGRIEPLEVTALADDFVPPEVRRAAGEALNHGAGAALGLDVVQDVLPNIGPDLGVCVLPPPDDKAIVPGAMTALRVRSGGPARRVDRALLNGLHSLAVLAVIQYNQGHADPMRLVSAWQDKVEVKYLRNDKLFPAGVRPAFALKDGYLVLATSPEIIRDFRDPKAAPSAVSSESPLLRCSARAFRKYFGERLDRLAAWAAKEHGLPEADAARRLRSLISACEFFDRVELVRRAAPGLVGVVIRVRTEQPIQK